MVVGKMGLSHQLPGMPSLHLSSLLSLSLSLYRSPPSLSLYLSLSLVMSSPRVVVVIAGWGGEGEGGEDGEWVWEDGSYPLVLVLSSSRRAAAAEAAAAGEEVGYALKRGRMCGCVWPEIVSSRLRDSSPEFMNEIHTSSFRICVVAERGVSCRHRKS